MKKMSGVCRVSAGVLAAAVVLAGAGDLFGQIGGRLGQRPAAVRAAEEADTATVVRFPQPNKAAIVRTPEFDNNAQPTYRRVTRRPREWALLEVHYSTGSRWTDELAFNYFVMTKGKNNEGKDAFSFYNASIRYVNIPKGDHMSCVALPPSLVERYGEPVAIALEIVSKEGKVLDSKSDSTIPFPSKEWWKDSKVLDNASVTRRSGLIDRSKTPFALINADDYEVVQ